MRVVAAGLVLMLAVGCEFQPVLFEQESTLNQQTRGVVLHPDGESAQVGMMGTTCEVDRSTGFAGTDYDYPGSDDEVQDIGVDDGGDVEVVVTSDKGVHVQRNDGWWSASSDDYAIDGAEDAVHLGDRVVVFSEDSVGCRVDSVHTDTPSGAELPPEACPGLNTITGDPQAGRAIVGASTGVYVVGDDSVETISDQPSELVAWDDAVDVLYTASPGDSLVSALEYDGALRWEVDVGGSVLALDDMGVRGAASVSVLFEDGGSTVLVLDGMTGEVTSQVRTSEPAHELAASDDGRGLAAVRDGEVDFYRVVSLWDVEF